MIFRIHCDQFVIFLALFIIEGQAETAGIFITEVSLQQKTVAAGTEFCVYFFTGRGQGDFRCFFFQGNFLLKLRFYRVHWLQDEASVLFLPDLLYNQSSGPL